MRWPQAWGRSVSQVYRSLDAIGCRPVLRSTNCKRRGAFSSKQTGRLRPKADEGRRPVTGTLRCASQVATRTIGLAHAYLVVGPKAKKTMLLGIAAIVHRVAKPPINVVSSSTDAPLRDADLPGKRSEFDLSRDRGAGQTRSLEDVDLKCRQEGASSACWQLNRSCCRRLRQLRALRLLPRSSTEPVRGRSFSRSAATSLSGSSAVDLSGGAACDSFAAYSHAGSSGCWCHLSL